jgi:glutathione S-transferase
MAVFGFELRAKLARSGPPRLAVDSSCRNLKGEAKMHLYYSPGACSLSPHIALREAGIPFNLEKVDLKTKQVADGSAFATVNAKGYVPALKLDNGHVLTEGPAIVQYIADQKPELGLAPQAGTMERYRLQEWLNFITSELHKAFGTLFNPTLPKEAREITLARLTQRLDWLAKELAHKTYAMGDKFTVADGYLFTILSWAKHVGIELSKWPTLEEYVSRVGKRPKVQEALKAEGLV